MSGEATSGLLSLSICDKTNGLTTLAADGIH
jgi:hypothetical protein